MNDRRVSPITNGRMIDIDISSIDVASDRVRQASPEKVEELKLSIGELGLLVPILVREPSKSGRHRLIGGLHRLRACHGLGWSRITAVILDISGVQARLAEVDENLVRNDLSPLEWAIHFAERKAIYEALNPVAGHGGDRRSQSAKLGTWSERFTAAAAKRFGLSETSIQRAVERYKNIDPDVRHQIADLALSRKGVELDALSRLEPQQQRSAVALILAGEARSVSVAARQLAGVRENARAAPVEAEFGALKRAWKAAGTASRARFLAYLAETGALDREAAQ
jgi:ParB family chromosome partitioning protein